MTEQATLTPEEAILAVASAMKVCPCTYTGELACGDCRMLTDTEPGVHSAGCTVVAGGYHCKGAGKVARFPMLRVVCGNYDAVANYVEGRGWTHAVCVQRQEYCRDGNDDCQGRGWLPVAWTDEYAIRLALQDQGIRVEHQHRRWYVKLPGTTTAEGYDDNLAVAADSAITAEST